MPPRRKLARGEDAQGSLQPTTGNPKTAQTFSPLILSSSAVAFPVAGRSPAHAIAILGGKQPAPPLGRIAACPPAPAPAPYQSPMGGRPRPNPNDLISSGDQLAMEQLESKRNMIGRCIMVVNALQGFSQMNELLAPLKAVCGVVNTALATAQGMLHNKEAWVNLKVTLERHLGLLAQQSERANLAAGSNSHLQAILRDYASALEDILVGVLTEMGVTEQDISPQASVPLRKKMSKVLVQLEADRIHRYTLHLNDALQQLSSSLQVHSAVEVANIHAKIDEAPMRKQLVKTILGIFRDIAWTKAQDTILQSLGKLREVIPTVIDLVERYGRPEIYSGGENDSSNTTWSDIAALLGNQLVILESSGKKIEAADMARDPNSPLPYYLLYFIRELEATIVVLMKSNGITPGEVPRDYESVLPLFNKSESVGDKATSLEASLIQFTTCLELYIQDGTGGANAALVSVFASIGQSSYASSADGGHHSRCLPGTRSTILEYIERWSMDRRTERTVYVLGDVAGTGKSTVALEMVHRWASLNRLGGRFFFARGIAGASMAVDCCIQIARELSSRYPNLNIPIDSVLDEASGFLRFETLWKKLVVDPLTNLEEEVIFVIDGLDECTESSRLDLLEALQRDLRSPALQNKRVRFFLTTRLEEDIAFGIQDKQTFVLSHLQQTSQQQQETTRDITLYVEYEFAKMRNPSMDPRSIRQLVERAEGLFIFASTVCAVLVRSFERQRLFDEILAYNGFTNLDALYTGILERGVARDAQEREWTRDVLSVILASQEPLPMDVLQEICSHVPSVRSVKDQLASVLRTGSGIEGDGDDRVFIIHQSFRDYLLQARRSGQNSISVHAGHVLIAHTALQALDQQLQWKYSAALNEGGGVLGFDTDCTELSNRARAQTTLLLRYAAVHWARHVGPILHLTKTFQPLRGFFKDKTTEWIEFVALMGALPSSMVAISVLDGQIKTHLKQWDTPLTPDMGEWCEAIIQAVQPNQDILRVFPWQIYTTALIFAPEGNLMKEASLQPWVPSVKKLNQPLSFVANNMLVGLNVPVKLVGHKGPVTCLAYSPDHRYLASGSEDHTAILWHSKFGVMSSLLRGHTAHITCLQFSPSSPILLSGSRDGTLRRWNIRTGASIEPVWKSHGEVRSLAFSPDGRRVLYGTATGGLFLIDSETGEILRPQFGSHSAAVTSIVLSPDRSLVATSSLDGTLDIWRWTGMMEHVSKVTHTSAITAATFLPDNSSIAFAATGIHVWDLAQQQVSSFEGYEEATFTSLIVTPNRMMLIGGLDDTGQLIQWWTLDERSKLGLAVHGKNTWGKVTSLVYNPVAASIASASTDGTVFLWSSDFANRVFNTGRARDARSMAFSKDGRFLAVGFPNAIKTERAVLVWDTTSGKLVRELRTGENASAIAFFPDGETIVCGSSERDLAVWKPDNTLMIAGFLRGSWQSPLIKCIGISDTGSHLATGTGSSIKVWCLVEPDGSQSPEWPRLVHTINCRSEPGSGVGFLWDMSALAYGSQAWDLLSDPPRSIQEEDEEARRREVVWEVFPHLVRFSKYEGKQHGRYWIHFGGQPPMMSMALPAEFKLGACAIHQEKVAYAADEEEVYVMDFTKMIQHALGTA